jgi:hypothetical protein
MRPKCGRRRDAWIGWAAMGPDWTHLCCTLAVSVPLSKVTHSIRVYLYQREPNGSYPLASSKAFAV